MMSKKRKNNAATSEGASYNKRSRPSYPEGEADGTSSSPSTQPRVDPTYGQRGAFPGLDHDGDELFYGPASDGLEYLKMVRSEARGVPNLLVAPKSTQTEQHADIYNSGVGDSRGYYANGAYTASTAIGPSLPTNTTAEDEERDPQDAYYTSLRLRFSLLRATLRCTPPVSAIAALDDDHPISLPAGSRKAFATWRHFLKTTDPLPAQLASLDQASVLRLVRIVTGGLKRARRIDRRMGAWAWGLLGKVREVGECGSEEVGVLRELGKRAVWVLRGWREAEKRGGGGVGGVDEEQEEDEEGLEGGDDVGDEAMEETEIVHQQDDGGAENLDSGVLESGGVAAESEVDQGLVCDNDELFEPQVEVTSSHGTVAHPRAPEQELHEVQDEDNLAHDNAEDGHNHEIDELAAAKERVRVKLDESMYVAGMLDREAPEVEDATFATLDMIITVVGEFYGQRDLLEFRDLWDELLQ